jgi:hypothetical protein
MYTLLPENRRLPAGDKPNVLIQPEYRKCAGFLYAQDDGGNDVPVGTAFFVEIEVMDTLRHVYAVTAQHVVNQDRDLILRVNIKTEGPPSSKSVANIRIRHDDWSRHPSNDVAIVRFIPKGNYDIRPIPYDDLMVKTEEGPRPKPDEGNTWIELGLGDALFFVGMFSPYRGHSRIEPIIRFGNIALMPDDPIEIKLDRGTAHRGVEAYLAEADSWGGQSGSPAFLLLTPDRHAHMSGGLNTFFGETPTPLVGLVHGHFDLTFPVMTEGESGPESHDVFKSKINSGITIIIPSYCIKEMLDGEPFASQRRQAGIEERHKSCPTPD